MELFLIRHAEAIDYETNTVKNDEYRFITPNGRNVTRKVAKSLNEELKEVEIIYTSPLIRAVQTAEVFAAKLRFMGNVEVVNELKNESTVSSLQKLLESNSSLSSIALVGHEPKMSLLVKSFSNKADLNDFRKSSVCRIDFDAKSGKGKFKWYFDSKNMGFTK